MMLFVRDCLSPNCWVTETIVHASGWYTTLIWYETFRPWRHQFVCICHHVTTSALHRANPHDLVPNIHYSNQNVDYSDPPPIPLSVQYRTPQIKIYFWFISHCCQYGCAYFTEQFPWIHHICVVFINICGLISHVGFVCRTCQCRTSPRKPIVLGISRSW